MLNEAAFLLLCAWAGAHTDAPVPEAITHLHGFHEALHVVALSEGWIYDGERVSGLERVRWCRWLAEGTPDGCVMDRLPPRAWIDGQTAFATAHIRWLEDQMILASSPWERRHWHDWLDEARDLRAGYEHLSQAYYYADATPGEYGVTRQLAETRHHLHLAGLYLGRSAVETGVLPPVVPLHRFRRGD
jgi:hypothetical protein